MADLALTTHVVPTRTQKSLDTKTTLVAGNKLKMELGDAELSTTVPSGETWNVHVVMNIDVR